MGWRDHHVVLSGRVRAGEKPAEMGGGARAVPLGVLWSPVPGLGEINATAGTKGTGRSMSMH